MTEAAVKSIAIIGGQATGWTAAAALAQALQGQRIQITVLESASDPLDEPAASTLPQTIQFHWELGIKEPALMRAAHGTFKLGTEYRGWHGTDRDYFQPLAQHGANAGIAFHHAVNKLRMAGEAVPLNDFSLCAVAARAGKFSHPTDDPGSILASLRYGLHLDSTGYAGHLRQFATAFGVAVRTGEVRAVQVDDGGLIGSVTLTDGEQLAADFFVDCSGAEARLLGQALDVGLEDWSHWLPADRAVSLAGPPASDPAPCTIVMAQDAGWSRQVPLQDRVVHEFVFSEHGLAPDQATDLLLRMLPGGEASAVASRSFASGRRNAFWQGNCVALGRAAGGFEPLEICLLQLVQSGAQRLASLFPGRGGSPLLAREYNRLTAQEYENIRDFLVLQYRARNGRQTAFWQAAREASPPDSLAHKLALFESQGQASFNMQETFEPEAWVSAYIGQERWPDGYDLFLDKQDFEPIRQWLMQMRQFIRQAADAMPAHRAYLEQYCRGG